MAAPRFNFEHADVSTWGIAALVCGTLAVFAANIGAVIPDSVIAGLHATRLQGGNLNQIRAHVAEVRSENQRINRDYRTMLTRLNLLDDDSGEVIRRLAAVERSLPLLIEALPVHSDIDRSLLTASIAATSPEVYEAEGGIVVVRRSALFDDIEEAPTDQPMPPLPDAGTSEYGVALGSVVAREVAAVRHSEIMGHAGLILSGMTFLLGEAEEVANARLIAGPFASYETAVILCEPLAAMGIACEPVPFEGQILFR